jgi:predicted small lipoprotein YifL
MSGFSMQIRALVILFLALSLLTACGRRGALEAPDRAESVSNPDEQTTSPVPGEPLLTDAISPGAQEPAEAAPEAAPPRRFFLDFLL